MKERVIDANALMDYCRNQKSKTIDCNDIARFPTYSTNEWHYVENGDLPKESIPVLILSSDDSIDDCIYIPCEGFKNPFFSTWYYPIAWIEKEKILPKKEK